MKELIVGRFCTNCGAELNIEHKFCTECGSKVIINQETAKLQVNNADVEFSNDSNIALKNKIFDVVNFVGGTVITLFGFFSTRDEYGFFSEDSTEWDGILFIIVGVSMIVFGFVRRNWYKKDDK